MGPGCLRTAALVGGLLGILIQPGALRAQDTITPVGQPQPPQMASRPGQDVPPPAPIFTQPQLESMLAPIALYPDQLLSDMLMAAAYPQEVADADRWVHDPANANLTGDALNAALAPVDWDPSVKSLVPFPQVLDTMAQHMDWTQQLGEAFVAQQGDVMNVVQGLRQQAEASGNLRPSPQMAVASTGGAITIEPATPNMLYVPTYDPAVVYGPWAYPQPPFVIYPPQVYATPIIFGVGFAIFPPLWGWGHWDWRHRSVFVDPGRFNAINARLIEEGHRPRIADRAWHVDRSRERDHGRPAFGHASAVAPRGQPHAGPAHAGPGPRGQHANAPQHGQSQRAPVHPASVQHGSPQHGSPHPAHAPQEAHAPSHAQPHAQPPHGAPAEHGQNREHEH